MKESLSKLVEMLDAQVKSIQLLKEFALEFIELAEPSKDPLGLTQPPPSVQRSIEKNHTPKDAFCGDDLQLIGNIALLPIVIKNMVNQIKIRNKSFWT